MRPCKCGRAVRLGAHKITVERRRGVSHYIAHMDGSPGLSGWTCIALKPYPKDESKREYAQLLNRWETAGSAGS